MIKLKNLWKIALATMAMSTMLVACDTDSKDNDDNNSNSDEKIVAKGGEGVYSYTVNIEDISSAWGGSTVSPAFSIMLLTDAQLEASKTANALQIAAANTPEYQMAAYGNLKIADTSKTGNFAIYGQKVVNDNFQYYTGIAATVTDTIFTVTVDMTKLVLTDLKALWTNKGEATMTNDDIVDLTGYKPYVLALAGQTTDADNYEMSEWNADLMAMTSGATFPTGELIKAAPTVPTATKISHIVGSMTATAAGWEHKEMENNTYTFTATADKVQFAFTMGNWDYRFAEAVVSTLNTEVDLKEFTGGDPAHVTVADGILTAGKEYIITFIPVDNHKAKVKITAK